MKAKIDINPLGQEANTVFMISEERDKQLIPTVIKTVRKVMGKNNGMLADILKEVLPLAQNDQEQSLVLFMAGFSLSQEINRLTGLRILQEAKEQHDNANKPKLITGQA